MNMRYTIDGLLDALYGRAYAVYDIFKGFFGEDFVDLQDIDASKMLKGNLRCLLENSWHLKPITEEDGSTCYEVSEDTLGKLMEAYSRIQMNIIVWFPRVTVTNEHNRSVTIQDLYAKVTIQLDGQIPYEQHGFMLNRATYSMEQFLGGYMHSHCNGIPKSSFTTFMRPCLGTGPIANTIMTLKTDYDEASWMLFCQELSMYVTVESLAGGPYRKLESISSVGKYLIDAYYGMRLSSAKALFKASLFTDGEYKAFVRYYLGHGHLSLMYRDGRFQCGMPFSEMLIDMSNAFIDFYNDTLADQHCIEHSFRSSLLLEVYAVDGKFYQKRVGTESVTTVDLDSYRNKLVLNFKGKEIRTTIIDTGTKKKKDEEDIKTIILDPHFALYVLENILKVINFRYKNGNNNTNNIASPYERVCYL